MATPTGSGDQFENLGIPTDVMPQELGQTFFTSLDQMLKKQEQGGIDSVLNSQEERGLFRSGQTEANLIDQVLGPSLARRQQALLPLAFQGASQARDERLGETNFQRTRQLSSEEFDRRMKELDQQNQYQMQLLQLQKSLGIGVGPEKPGFGEIFASSFANGLGSGASKAIF